MSISTGEPDMSERARKIAKAMLDGLTWLPEVGKSTHYHAYWVRPSWVSEMKRMYKFGVHTFYRPKAWGDSSDARAGARRRRPRRFPKSLRKKTRAKPRSIQTGRGDSLSIDCYALNVRGLRVGGLVAISTAICRAAVSVVIVRWAAAGLSAGWSAR